MIRGFIVDNLEQLTIFGNELNVDKTIKKVRHFFEVDYPVAKRRAHRDVTGLSSPVINGMPKGTPIGNATEERLINRAYCRQVVAATPKTIDECSKWSRKLLKWLYLNGEDDTYCINNIPYSERWYYKRLKPTAFIEFAEIYPVEELLVFEKVQ